MCEGGEGCICEGDEGGDEWVRRVVREGIGGEGVVVRVRVSVRVRIRVRGLRVIFVG